MKNPLSHLLVAIVLLICGFSSAVAQEPASDKNIIKVGIVGCDTSHVAAFTKLLNDPKAGAPFDKFEVVVAYPGGSPDIPDSRDRLAGYVSQLKQAGVAIVDSAAAVAEQADVILLESVDGRTHFPQFREVARGKPVFIDKPAAASLADVLTIFRHADATNTPCFSSSGLRFGDQVTGLAADKSIGEVLGCETAGPLKIEPHHPDLFWYGIHGVEALYTLMGTGCETVARTDAESQSLVVGRWDDGRIGSFRGLKQGKSDYAFNVYGTNGIAQKRGFSGYQPLVRAICEFFTTGKSPVDRQETIEIFAFMEAADESHRAGGRPIAIRDVIARAEKASAASGGESAGGASSATTP